MNWCVDIDSVLRNCRIAVSDAGVSLTINGGFNHSTIRVADYYRHTVDVNAYLGARLGSVVFRNSIFLRIAGNHAG